MARSILATDSIELRWTETGSTVSGQILGVSADATSPVRQARSVTASFGGINSATVSVSGSVTKSVQYRWGKMSGPVTFTDAAGLQGKCTGVTWSLQPSTPPS